MDTTVASLARRQRQFPKFRLFNANLVIAVDSTTTEVFAPVSVLVVDHQQSEASIFVERWASGCTRHCCSQNGRTLIVSIKVCVTCGKQSISYEL